MEQKINQSNWLKWQSSQLIKVTNEWMSKGRNQLPNIEIAKEKIWTWFSCNVLIQKAVQLSEIQPAAVWQFTLQKSFYLHVCIREDI